MSIYQIMNNINDKQKPFHSFLDNSQDEIEKFNGILLNKNSSFDTDGWEFNIFYIIENNQPIFIFIGVNRSINSVYGVTSLNKCCPRFFIDIAQALYNNR